MKKSYNKGKNEGMNGNNVDMVQLEELIEAEQDQNLKTAMEDLDEFFVF